MMNNQVQAQTQPGNTANMTRQDPVLVNEWHPVLLSSDLSNHPASVQVLGEQVVVFRTSRGVHAFKDLCIHRGVPLSLGKVEGEEIVCPYHGWSYDGSGRCTRIPALPAHQAIPAKARAVTYPCLEAHGLIWVCIGTPSRPEPAVGKHISPDFKSIPVGPYRLQASGPRVVENFLDVAHLMFVHEGLLGDSRFAEIGDYQVHDEDGMLRTDEIVVYQPDPDGRGQGGYSRYVYEVLGPLCAALTKRTEGTDQVFRLFLAVLPETERKSTAFMIIQRNYATQVPDEIFINFQNRLIEQDRVIVEHQKPELLPLDLQAELHLKCDRVSIAYRRRLRELGLTFGTE